MQRCPRVPALRREAERGLRLCLVSIGGRVVRRNVRFFNRPLATTRANKAFLASSLAQQLRQLGDVTCNPVRLNGSRHLRQLTKINANHRQGCHGLVAQEEGRETVAHSCGPRTPFQSGHGVFSHPRRGHC
jgi:hypothetical protein